MAALAPTVNKTLASPADKNLNGLIIIPTFMQNHAIKGNHFFGQCRANTL
jgi:hypothetical protein